MPLKILKEDTRHPLSRIKHIIAVAAGKGGVGKSSVAVNLALSLQQLGHAVGLLDADVYGPSLRKMLPEEKMPVQKEQQIFPALCRGIKLISMAYFRKEQEAAAVRAPIANGIITQFIRNVEWGDLDFLIIDFPPGTGDIQLTLAQQANLFGAVMVTTPQEVSMLDVRKAIHLFEQVKVPILGIVENMSYYYHKKTDELLYLFGKGAGEKLSAECGAPLLAKIPIDPLLSQYGDQGKSIFQEENCDKNSSKTIFIEFAKQVKSRIAEMIEGTGHSLNNFEINQKDECTFTLRWKDGTLGVYRLSELQKICPCANCTDEITGKRLLDICTIDEHVKAVGITNIGRYALRIQFTSGCSSGIYGLDLLYKMARGDL